MAEIPGQIKRAGSQLTKVGSISPFGAKSEGATPDQVKMAGTPAQKTPVLQEAVSQQQIAPTQVDPTTQQQQTLKQSQQLTQLKDVQPQLQQVAARKLSEITGTAGVGIASKEVLDTAFDSDLEIQALLKQYAANPEDQTPLVTLSGELAQRGATVTVDQIMGWINTGSRAIGTAAGEFLGDDILMSDFNDEDWTSLGFTNQNDVAALLGVDTETFQNLSYAEFQDMIESVKESAFSEVQQLEQQLSTVPPGSAAAAQIQQRLAELTSAGITAAERNVQETVNAIDLSNRITLNGIDYTAEELLSDDKIAEIVSTYVEAAPEDRENIIGPQFAGFRQWIESNEAGLKLVADSIREEAQEFEIAQQVRTDLQSKLNQVQGLAEAVGIDLSVAATTDELAAIQQELGQNAVYQTITDPTLTASEQTAIAAALTPELIQNMTQQGITKEAITKGWKLGQEIKNKPILSQLADVNVVGDFILDDEEQRRIESNKLMLDRLAGNETAAFFLKQSGMLKEISNGRVPIEMLDYANVLDNMNRPVIGNDRVLDLIKRGTITMANAESAIPQVMEKLKNFDDAMEQTKIMHEADDNGVLSYIMTKDVTVDQIQTAYQTAQKLASMGDSKAQQQVDKFRQFLDMNKDGVIDKADTDILRQGMGTLTPEHLHKSIIEDIDLTNAKDQLQSEEFVGSVPEQPIYQAAINALDDGVISEDEADSLWQGGGHWLSESWRQQNMPSGFKTSQEWEASKDQQEQERLDKLQAEIDQKEADRLAEEEAEFARIKEEQKPEDEHATDVAANRSRELDQRRKDSFFGKMGHTGGIVSDASKQTTLGKFGRDAQKQALKWKDKYL